MKNTWSGTDIVERVGSPKLRIDNEADALYLTLDESDAVESEEVSPGIIVDYNADKQVIGIELLYLSKRSPKLDTGRLLFETAPASRSRESEVMELSKSS